MTPFMDHPLYLFQWVAGVLEMELRALIEARSGDGNGGTSTKISKLQAALFRL